MSAAYKCDKCGWLLHRSASEQARHDADVQAIESRKKAAEK